MNYNLTIFYRALKKNRLISIINVLGLTLGILSALFIFEYVYYERNYDTHQEDAERLYRVAYKRYSDNALLWNTANSYYPMGFWLKENYNEVTECAVIRRNYNLSITSQFAHEKKLAFFESKAYYATSTFFKLFSISLKQGDYVTLDKPNTVLISEKLSHKLFGNDKPIGRILKVNNQQNFTVTGVFEDLPQSSHVQSQLFFSLESVLTQRPRLRTQWAGDDLFHTYIKLRKDVDVQAFEAKALSQMVDLNYREQLAGHNQYDEVYLQSVPSIHLHSDIDFESEPPGSASNVSILYGFAFLLLIIAWINYVNLITAQSVERAKEIGVKKTFGVRKKKLIQQFIVDALFFNLLCLILAFCLFFILNPLYKNVLNISNVAWWQDVKSISFLAFVFASGVFLSSFYPAYLLSSFSPVKVLKGRFKNSKHSLIFRKSLIIVQFSLSLILMIGTFVSHYQSSFLLQKQGGLSYDNNTIFRLPENYATAELRSEKTTFIANKLETMPAVGQYSFSSDVPGEQVRSFFGARQLGLEPKHTKWYDCLYVDDDFISHYEMNIIAGRTFFKDEKEEANVVIVDRACARRLGFDNPQLAINKKVKTNRDQVFTIVGVVNDFHFLSVKMPSKPFIIVLNSKRMNFLSVKTSPDLTGQEHRVLIADIKQLFKTAYPDQPFDYFDLGDKMRTYLNADCAFARVFALFSFIAILVAIIGVMGLLLIYIKQNIKSIAVRKTLGAQRIHVFLVLAKQLSLQLLIAIFLALPLSYIYFKDGFLASYNYRIDLSLWYFLVPVIILISIITIVMTLMVMWVFNQRIFDVLKYE